MLPPTYTSCDYRCVTFVSLSSTCVTPGISRRTHHEGEPCNGVYMCVARIVLSFVAWRPLLLLRDTIIKYAVQGTRYDTSSGAINPSKYQESCRCRLETRIYFSIGNNCMQNSFDIRNGELYSYSNKFLPCAESSYPATSSAVTQHRTAKPSPRARTLLV